MGKPILCLDFDGVIHSYTSGWKGAGVISDPPVPGALDFIQNALGDFDVQIYSSRSGQNGGIDAMQEYLCKHLVEQFPHLKKSDVMGFVLEMIGWPQEKPPAMITIDDRAITFTGEWPDMATLKSFKPWNKQ